MLRVQVYQSAALRIMRARPRAPRVTQVIRMAATAAPTIDDIRAAAARLRGVAMVTPLLESAALNAMAGRRILAKAECLQPTGAFKVRGAWNALASLGDAARRGVLAWSSGNHAQAVALAAARHGVPAVIVMPDDAPRAKMEGTRALGAEVVPYNRNGESREAIGQRMAAERNLAIIHPFDAAATVAGQGSCGLELAAQARALGVDGAEVLVPCSGGGLASGIAIACEAEAPHLRVRTAEPQGHDDMARSLAADAHLANEGAPPSLCDALLAPRSGDIAFATLRRLAGPGLVVDDGQVLAAMAAAFRHLRLVVEPGGAAALACALFHPDALDGDTAICILTGGNVDRACFQRALATLE